MELAAGGHGQGDRGQPGRRPAPPPPGPAPLDHHLEGEQGGRERPPHDGVEVAGQLEHPVGGAGVGQGAGGGQQGPAGVAAQPGEGGQPGEHRGQGQAEVVGRDQADQRPGDRQQGRPGHVQGGGPERGRPGRPLAQVEVRAAEGADVVDDHRLDEDVLEVVAAVHAAGPVDEVGLGGHPPVAGHRPEVVRVQGERPGQGDERCQAGQGDGDPGPGPAAGRPRVGRHRRRVGCRGAGGRCLGGAQGPGSGSRWSRRSRRSTRSETFTTSSPRKPTSTISRPARMAMPPASMRGRRWVWVARNSQPR